MPIGRVGPEFTINTTPVNANMEMYPTMAVLADGRFICVYAAWNNAGGSDIRARLYNADGTATGNDFVVNSTTVDNQVTPAVTALAGGGFAVTWSTFYDERDGGRSVVARVFDGNGAPRGGDFLAVTTTASDQSDPTIAALPSGGFVVTWRSPDEAPSDGWGLRGRMFTAGGAGIAGDFGVNATTDGHEQGSAVTSLSDGRFVVAWFSNDSGAPGSHIRARFFSANGSPNGGDFVVNTTLTSGDQKPALTRLSDGRVLISWQSGATDPGDGSGSGIRGRIYGADGRPVGNDFLVNKTTYSVQEDPAIVGLADGRFVVAWSSDNLPGDGIGISIRARVFNIDGTPAGDDFIVNTTAGSQIFPSVAAFADGRFVVSWQSSGANGGARAQIFDPTKFTGTALADIWQGGNLADRIAGGNGNDRLSGLAGNDLIAGDADNDILNGGAGADSLSGGTGNDIFYVDNAADKVFEAAAQGTDTVYSSVSFTLAAGQHVEAVATTSLAGTGAITLVGNELAQRLTGNNGINALGGLGGNDTLVGHGGNDRLNGGIGADQMYGGLGNDAFYVDNAADRVFEAAGQGADIVYSSVSYALSTGQHVETLATTLVTGTGAINLAGNELAQRINGDNGVNVLSGAGGNDVLAGYGGNDFLRGGTGNDTLVGGIGSDYFVFDTALNPTANVDTITDFNIAADTIRLDNAVMAGLGITLGTLSAAKFWKNTTGLAHDADDRIIYETDTGKLFYDSNGIAAGGAVQIARLAPNLALTYADFQVV